MPSFSFEHSGQGEVPIETSDLQQAAVNLGYAKPGVDNSKPLPARADMKAFLGAYGCNAVSMFKKKFYSEVLTPVGPGGKFISKTPKKAEVVEEVLVTVNEEDIPDVSRYDELVGSYPDLKWRMISRPGGATMKPIDFYRLGGAKSQVEEGDNTTEKPMWAATGGLDFNGREAWDQWVKFKGLSTDDAKKAFCKVYAEAQANPKANFRQF